MDLCFLMLQKPENGSTNINRSMLCARIHIISEPQSALDRKSSVAFATGPALAAVLEATNEGVLAHAMRSRFPWH